MWTDRFVILLRTKKLVLRKIVLSIANVNILIVVTCTFCIINKTHGRRKRLNVLKDIQTLRTLALFTSTLVVKGLFCFFIVLI